MSKVGCAIYTRKSSEEGLEQDFNSLHAQHEACAAYIKSQASEGWKLVAGRYEDGGISGGALARPGLQRLLTNIAAGHVDVVVVYKVDRLTRSLLDFSKLVEAFDKAGTSFVSVTQSFNTTTSMGRLTLNMLLSFAQFEREVTAERIRDKIAQSKARGMWMGGTPPIGYRAAGRSLAIVDQDAPVIRRVFELYLQLGRVSAVLEQLEAEGLRTPQRTSARDRSYGGAPFTRGQVYRILATETYIGRIEHGGRSQPGNHPAIVEPETFQAAREQLAASRNGERLGQRAAEPSLLAGLLLDDRGVPMVSGEEVG
jgi:DNA invertase Pin-like site-specific DNA recombinase